MKTSAGAVEYTSFKLRSPFSLQDFIAENQDVDVWLKKQKGFRSRRMFENSDGRIYDILLWNTEKNARASTAALLDQFRDSAIHELIDQRTVEWFVAPVAHIID